MAAARVMFFPQNVFLGARQLQLVLCNRKFAHGKFPMQGIHVTLCCIQIIRQFIKLARNSLPLLGELLENLQCKYRQCASNEKQTLLGGGW